MKLIYLYFDGWLLPEPKQLNFDSDYKCHFGNNVLSVNKDVVLPKNFFSNRKGEEAVVEDISAIIGKNGSGKTSIARCIASIVTKHDLMPQRFIVLVEIGGRLECFARKFDFRVDSDIAIKKFDLRAKHWLSEVFEFVYVSPHYTPGDQLGVNSYEMIRYGIAPLRVPKVADLSMGALFAECQMRSMAYSKYFREISPHRMNPISACERIILQRIMEFGFLTTDGTQGFYNNIYYPETIEIAPDETQLIYARAAFEDISALRLSNEVVIEMYELLKEFVYEDFSDDFFMRCMQCYIASRCLHADFRDDESSLNANLYPFLLIGIGKECATMWKRGGKHRRKAYRKFVDFLHSPLAPTFSIGGEIEDREPAVYELFDTLLKLIDYAEKIDTLSFRCALAEVGEKKFFRVCDLVRLHFACKEGSDFLRFSFHPPYPAGYTSLLFMWAQLYNYIGHYPPKTHPLHTNETGNILIFMDEAELSLHPEMQRKFVEEAIAFCEHIDHGIKFHVIYATHSPLILSDIPSGNIVALEGVPMPQTFASNIFDLYRLNFFLENGTIGAFAAGKLNKVLDKINGGANDKLDDDEKRTVQLIGDSRLKQYFMDRAWQ